MLPEAGAFELVFLAMVALIVVGPKDLPMLLRKVGQFTAKMRGLAGEFRASFDEMARQSELDELRREVEALRDGRFGDTAKPALEGHLSDIRSGLSFHEPAPAASSPLEPSAAPDPAPSPVAHEVAGPAEEEPGPPLPPPAPHAAVGSAPALQPTPETAH